MFRYCELLTNIDGLKNWNVANVTYMSTMFNNTKIASLNALRNWNVANVSTFNAMFQSCQDLTDVSGINGWNINSSAIFTQMFYNTPSHPEFTKFPNGTWDANGSFTPNA